MRSASRWTSRKGERGETLVAVMIASAIGVVVALSMATMMNNQNVEVRALSEKLLAKDLETSLRNVINLNSQFCECLFRGSTVNTAANPRTMGGQPTLIPDSYTNVPAAPAACTPSATPIVSTANPQIPGSSMTVNAIRVVNVVEPVPGSGRYTARLEVVLANSVRTLQPLGVNIGFNVDTTVPGPVKPVTTCNASNPVFQMVCASGTAGGAWPRCCQIQTETGVVECREKTSNWGAPFSWKAGGSFPFGNAPLPAGVYSLALNGGNAGGDFPLVCRVNGVVGTSNCVRALNWAWPPVWIPTASPW